MNLLTWTVFLPLAGMVLCTVVPKDFAGRACRWINFATCAVVFVLTILIWREYDLAKTLAPGAGFWLETDINWIPAFHIRYHVAVDGVSVALLLLTSFVSLTGAIASWKIEKSPRGYHAMYLLLVAGMLGVFVSLDLFLFYLFWEVMLLPMYFLIGIWGGPRRQYAAIKFFLYTLVGSVLLLAGVILIYLWTGSKGTPTFQIPDILALAQGPGGLFAGWAGAETIQILVFFAFFVGFAIKVPSFPFHTWLPDAHVEAPTPISMILAGVLLKMGGYGLIRMAYPFFPGVVTNSTVGYVIVALALISIVYGAFVAMAQTDFKKLVAYSSVSHMGFVTLGLQSLTPEGMNGAMYMMLAHGTISAMLFMVVGVIYDRAHHRDLDRFGGLAWVMPSYFVLAAFALFASLGLPGLSGFIAELTVLLGSFQPYRVLTLVATIGMVVTAAYYLITLQKVFLGETPLVYRDKAHYPDATGREMLVLVPLAIVTLWMGILPQPWMDIYQTDLHAIMDHTVKTAQAAVGK
jgi:NADH-quinone oxidoreductase subunit M